MPLLYHPNQGEVLKCDYSGFSEPEMTKSRWVVVVSPRHLQRPGLSTIVALSTTPPNPARAHHHKLVTQLPHNEPGVEVWAKCDMVFAASHKRLHPWWRDRSAPGGKRVFVPVILDPADLKAIQAGLLHSVGLGGLTKHL